MKDKKKTIKSLFSKKETKKPETFQEQIMSLLKILPQAILFVMIINGLALASFVVPTESMQNTVMAGDFLFVNRFKYGPTTPQIIPFVNIPLPYYKFPGFWEPEVNDVIVFVYPGNKNELESKEFMYYLKRCVAKAGDSLTVKGKDIYVNGELIDFPEHGNKIFETNNRAAGYPNSTRQILDDYTIYVPKIGDIIPLNSHNLKDWEMFIRREGHEVTYDIKNIYIDGHVTTEYTVERDYCFGMGDNRDNSTDSRIFGFIPYENVVGTPMVVYWSWDPKGSVFNNLKQKISDIRWSRLGNIIL